VREAWAVARPYRGEEYSKSRHSPQERHHAAAVPPPRRHSVRYAGVLAPASKLRARIVPKPTVALAPIAGESPEPKKVAGSRYRPWAELLKRCFSIDVLTCTGCGGRMRLVALVTEPASIRRFLRGVRETSDAPSARRLAARPTGRAAS